MATTPYAIWERSTGPTGRARTAYEIRDQDGNVVARARVWADAHRKLAALNVSAAAQAGLGKVG